MSNNVINPSSISFESILADLTAYVKSKPESSRWLDFLEGSAGQIVLELIAGLGVFRAYNELAKRLESYLDFARLQSSVYELAFDRGFLVPPAEAPELLLNVTPNSLITLNDGDLIGTLQDYSVFSIGGTQILTAGVSQTITCVVGNFEDRTLTLATNAQFSTVEVNFATDATPRKNLARQLEQLKFGSQVLFLIDDITQISERGAFSGTTPIYVIRRALPSEAKLYIGNGTLGWFDETATSIEYKTLTFDDDIQSKLSNNVTLTIDATLNSQTILSRGSILLSTESVRGLAKFYPIDGRVVQNGDYERVILKYYGSGGLDVVEDVFAWNTDPDEQVYLLTTSAFGTRDLDNITTLINSRIAQGIQVFYHQVPEEIPIIHFIDNGIAGKTTVRTSFNHGLSSGRTIVITDTLHYDGSYVISNASDDVFDIPINLEISILHFATNGAGGTTIKASVSHGLANGSTVQIRGTTHYNNSYVISNVAGTTFDIPINLGLSIAHFADNGGGGTTVSFSTNHGLITGEKVQITGTTNYNTVGDNRYTIFNVTPTTYDIPVAFVADDATGISLVDDATGTFIPDDATGKVNLGIIFTCKFNAPGITSDQITQADAYLSSLYKKFFRVPTTISTADLAVKLSALLGIQVFPGTGPITHFADNGSGGTRVTTSVTTPANGSIIVITGTTNYNGTYTVFNSATITFDIDKVFSVDDATGNWAYTDLILSETNFLKLVDVLSWSN